MSAGSWAEQIGDGLAFLAILATLVALAVAFAPPMPGRRLAVPAKRGPGAGAKRMRDAGRY